MGKGERRLGCPPLFSNNQMKACPYFNSLAIAHWPSIMFVISVQLIPIDHGYVLPVTFEHLDFEWLWYPQAKQAFSATTLEYIAALDPDADAAILRELEIEEGAVQVMQAVTILLKKGADAGLTLRQIANLVRYRREVDSGLSTLWEGPFS